MQVNYNEWTKTSQKESREAISKEAMQSLQAYNDDDVDDEPKYLSDYEPSDLSGMCGCNKNFNRHSI